MRTEQEWQKFGQHVKVGDRVQWHMDDMTHEGVLLENYPHDERAREANDLSACIDLLMVKFDDGEESSILANYEYFQVQGDETWWTFDDILMFDDAPLPFITPIIEFKPGGGGGGGTISCTLDDGPLPFDGDVQDNEYPSA